MWYLYIVYNTCVIQNRHNVFVLDPTQMSYSLRLSAEKTLIIWSYKRKKATAPSVLPSLLREWYLPDLRYFNTTQMLFISYKTHDFVKVLD